MKISNVILSILLGLLWAGIFFVSFIFIRLSDILCYFENGSLRYLFVFLYALAILLPILFRKKFKTYDAWAMGMIACAVLSVLLCGLIYLGAKGYIAHFSKEKWDKNEKLRIYMVDDLEHTYSLIGKSKKELKELLGEPTAVSDGKHDRYEYVIGESITDPYTYQVTFEDGLVIDTKIMEH